MKVPYLDESGGHDLVHIRPAYSVFVIGGIIVDREYDRTVLQPEVTKFKREWFDTDAVILHSVDIFQGKKGFQRLRRDRSFRLAFLADLQDLLARLDYQVVACVIHKDKHVAKYGAKSLDPYDFGLQVVVERFCFEIGDVSDGGVIVAEKRRHDLDYNLDVAWEKLRVAGTY